MDAILVSSFVTNKFSSKFVTESVAIQNNGSAVRMECYVCRWNVKVGLLKWHPRWLRAYLTPIVSLIHLATL